MSTVAFSVGRAKRPDMAVSNNAKFVPGPGTYQAKTSSVTKSDPSWGFGSSSRPALASAPGTKDLGPGAYDIKQRAIEGSRYSIGMINHKQKKYESISPGPGAYKPAYHAETTLKFSMGSKLEHGSALQTKKDASNSPGPGGYNPKANFKNDGFTKFGQSQR